MSIRQYDDTLTGEPVNRSVPHISLHHVTRFEPITAAHFDQKNPRIRKWSRDWKAYVYMDVDWRHRQGSGCC